MRRKQPLDEGHKRVPLRATRIAREKSADTLLDHGLTPRRASDPAYDRDTAAIADQ
jgi:hypothetical protein